MYLMNLVFLSITNQFFDKNEYDGFKSAYSSYIYHRLNLNKDLNIDVVVTKHIIITDPNKLFTFSPIYYKEFYSYHPTIIETNRKVGLNSETTIMNVKIVFREDDQEVMIYRNFETLENMIANIATILFAVYFVFKLLLFFFKKGNLTLSLLNKIYKFKEEDDSKIDFAAFNSVLGIGTMLEKNKLGNQDNKQVLQGKKDKQEANINPKIEIDHSLANLNQRNESQQDNLQDHSQDNPLRIEFKLKGSLEIPKKDNETTKDKTNNSVSNNSAADRIIQKPKTKRDAEDSKKNMIELQSINNAKNQDSMIEIDHDHDHEHDHEKKFLHGLTYLTKNNKNEKYYNRLVIPKIKLFFFICFGQCYRRKSLEANYYYVGNVFLNYDLSIETFLKKAIEYETLKKLLLNDSHRKMLLDYQKRRISKDNFANTLNEMKSLTEHPETEISKV